MWIAGIGAGLSVVWTYANTPGVSAHAPVRLPGDSQIKLDPKGDTLIMLVHPQCPCSRASIGELAELMAHTSGHLTAYVLFIKPAGFADNWEKTDLWRSAAAIPGVTVLIDDDGAEARRFRVATSGQTILYDAAGQLLFSGGITESRGHAGDSAGRDAVESLVNGGTTTQTETAVFGCPLFDPNSECRKSEGEGTGP